MKTQRPDVMDPSDRPRYIGPTSLRDNLCHWHRLSRNEVGLM